MMGVQQIGHAVSASHKRTPSAADVYTPLTTPSDAACVLPSSPASSDLVILQEAPSAAARAGASADLASYIGHSTGSGQCVALVRATDQSLGPASLWRRGDAVQGNTALAPGTAIATFTPAGHYANATDGSSHAAIYLGQNASGMQVLDQWAGSAAAIRTIAWSNPGVAANTGSAFHVVLGAGS